MAEFMDSIHFASLRCAKHSPRTEHLKFKILYSLLYSREPALDLIDGLIPDRRQG